MSDLAVKVKSFAAVLDADGLLTSEASPDEETVYGPEDFDGAFWTDTIDGDGVNNFGAARTVSVTPSALTAGWDGVTPIVVEGFYGRENGNPKAVSEEIQIAANGGAKVVGTQPFNFPPGPTFTFPSQPGSGTFTLGVEDIVAPDNALFLDVRADGAGDVAIEYDDGSNDVHTMIVGERLAARLAAVLATTAVAVTLFWGSDTREQ